jgi:hypothetical protein
MRSMIAVFSVLFTVAAGNAADMKCEINLDGKWKFELGNDPAYAEPGYDDSKWDYIRVPDTWENRGYPGYDGFAWYRISFDLPRTLKGKALNLNMGRIDDTDKTYMNGHLVGGMGSAPPKYVTAYDKERIYPLPDDILKFGETNVIAVQVYDDEQGGGIVSGRVGIYTYDWVNLKVNLAGKWSFAIGDRREWSRTTCDESDFETILVPSKWETQGYPDYDGYAWYRKTFYMDKELSNEKLILALGKIDDCDEVYLNGTKIGSTGHFPSDYPVNENNNFYNRDRYYVMPDKLIIWNGDNTIAVKVYDVWGDGGIYEGPVGITTKGDYIQYKRTRPQVPGLFQDLFRDWF